MISYFDIVPGSMVAQVVRYTLDTFIYTEITSINNRKRIYIINLDNEEKIETTIKLPKKKEHSET